jgi:FKBP-type peptidyl-prolyl cis-trans isomerase
MKTKIYFAIAAVAAMVYACKEPVANNDMEAEVMKELADWKPSAASLDSVCYYLGVNFASQWKGQLFDDMGEFDMEAFRKGMEEAFKAGQPKEYGDTLWAASFSRNPWEMTSAIPEYFKARRVFKSKYNERFGEKFLEENKSKTGVKVTESGLQYVLHSEGEDYKVSAKDTVVLNYKGTLLNGDVFDSGDTTEFVANKLVKGWTEGLGLLGKGGKATLYIPSGLAYDSKPPHGSIIHPLATLIVEVEVLDIKKNK